MQDTERSPIVAPQVVVTEEAEFPSIINPVTGKVFLTNALGRQVIELADGSRTSSQIALEVSRRFPGVAAENIHRDVAAFLADSAAKGLLTWTSPK